MFCTVKAPFANPLSHSLSLLSALCFLCKSNCNFGLEDFAVIVSIHFHINHTCLFVVVVVFAVFAACQTGFIAASFLQFFSLLLLLCSLVVVVVVSGISMLLGLTFRCYDEI